MDFLEHIVKEQKCEIYKLITKKTLQKIRKESEVFISTSTKKHSLTHAILNALSIGVIAEIKRQSPSEGALTMLGCKDIARLYERSEADAVSVLTNRKYFGGDISYLKKVRNLVSIPIFRKDFIINEYQIYETLLAGGDALLLMSTVLTTQQLRGFIALCSDVGLEYIVEVHDERDLSKALDAHAQVIGVNNRDLRTMSIDLATTQRLIEYIPKDRLIISESGIYSVNDTFQLLKCGVDGVLVGTSIIKSQDPIKKISELKNF